MNTERRAMLKIALTAHIFEGYETLLMGFMALEIGRVFFPGTGDKTALMLSFSVFATSFLARPLGSVFFGWWAGRHGAGIALRLTLILGAIPAALIALLPTYATTGYLATGLLVALRVLQGFASGGDAPLCAYFVALNTPGPWRGLYCGLAACSSFIGWLLASLVVYLLPYAVSVLSRLAPTWQHATLLPDAWRWPFLICIPLSLWVFSMRRTSFASLVTQAPVPHRAWRKLPATPLLQAVALVAFLTTQLYTLFVWLPSYLHIYVGVSSADARATNVIALIVFSISLVGAGYATRWIQAPKIALFGLASLTLLSYPLFVALQGADFAALLWVQLAFAPMAGCVYGATLIVLPDIFKDNWQGMGMTVAYTFPVVVFGGTAPLVCGYLIDTTHLLTAPALYIAAIGLIALPVAYRLAFPATGDLARHVNFVENASLSAPDDL